MASRVHSPHPLLQAEEMLNDFGVLNLIEIVCGLTSHTLENVLSTPNKDVASVIAGYSGAVRAVGSMILCKSSISLLTCMGFLSITPMS